MLVLKISRHPGACEPDRGMRRNRMDHYIFGYLQQDAADPVVYAAHGNQVNRSNEILGVTKQKRHPIPTSNKPRLPNPHFPQ